MMPSKVLVGCTTFALALAGCATVRKEPGPASTAIAAPAATPAPSPARSTDKPKPRAAARPAPRPSSTKASPSRANLPAMIGHGATWVQPGRTLVVNRGAPAARQAVPIFRQASVLNSVRASLAGAAATPHAEFRRGVLTLTFESGSNAEVASAVRRAISTPETGAVAVYLEH